jgi:antitoxin ParD1/3/4
MARASRPITVTLGDLHDRVAERVSSGAYASASEVVRAALRALDREEAALNEWLRKEIDESLNDPRPDLSADEVFRQLRSYHERQMASDRNEKV